MSEPTIDEMLDWVGRFETNAKERGLAVDDYDLANLYAIRAILEQHRKPEPPVFDADEWERERLAYERKVDQQSELEAIRVFVERVEKRGESIYCKTEDDDWPSVHLEAFRDELAAMESEVKE